MQLEMFENIKVHFEGGLECNNCGVTQPVENFQHMLSGEIKRKCRTCARNQSNLVKHLKTIHTYPDDSYLCPICTRSIEEISRKGQKRLQNWVLDHCHDTETYRGWVCHHCNMGLGAFSDSPDRVIKAYEYLKSHETKLNEGK
jgi:hypothetical protein|tara:strand:+ start:1038 stop:1466 length:429 start_codon:yes stop_codon:yes gene_type:complete